MQLQWEKTPTFTNKQTNGWQKENVTSLYCMCKATQVPIQLKKATCCALWQTWLLSGGDGGMFQLNEDPPTLHSHVGELKTLWSACELVVYLATFCLALRPLLTCIVLCDLHRKPECDIRIQLPQVSKEHCRIDLNENKEVTIMLFRFYS